MISMETDNYWNNPIVSKTVVGNQYSFEATVQPEDLTCPDVSGNTLSGENTVEVTCAKNQKIPLNRIEDLRDQFRSNGGDIVMEGDEDYEMHSKNYDQTCPYVPYVVFLPATEADVAAAIALIKEFDEKFSIGTSRINQSCFTMTLGALINLRNFMTMEADEENNVFTVGAGVIQFEAMNFLMENHPSKLVITLWGMMGGMVGPSVGGGIMWFLSQRYGTMAENALEYTIVMGDGEVMIANDSENPDLFWLLRGGGLAPGVITQMKYRLHDVPSRVVAYDVLFAANIVSYDDFKNAMSVYGQWFNALYADGNFDNWAVFNYGMGILCLCPGDETECDYQAFQALAEDREFWEAGVVTPMLGDGRDFWTAYRTFLVPFVMQDRHPSWMAQYAEGGYMDPSFTYEDLHGPYPYHDDYPIAFGYGNTGYWVDEWTEIYNEVDLWEACYNDMFRVREPGTELWGCSAGFVYLGGIRRGGHKGQDIAWPNEKSPIFIGVWNQGPGQKDIECSFNERMLSTNTIKAGYFNYGNPCMAEESLYPNHVKARTEEYRARYDPDSMFTDSMNYWVWKELEYCQDMYHCSGNGATSGLVADGCPCDCEEGYSGEMCEMMAEESTEAPCEDDPEWANGRGLTCADVYESYVSLDKVCTSNGLLTNCCAMCAMLEMRTTQAVEDFDLCPEGMMYNAEAYFLPVGASEGMEALCDNAARACARNLECDTAFFATTDCCYSDSAEASDEPEDATGEPEDPSIVCGPFMGPENVCTREDLLSVKPCTSLVQPDTLEGRGDFESAMGVNEMILCDMNTFATADVDPSTMTSEWASQGIDGATGCGPYRILLDDEIYHDEGLYWIAPEQAWHNVSRLFLAHVVTNDHTRSLVLVCVVSFKFLMTLQCL